MLIDIQSYHIIGRWLGIHAFAIVTEAAMLIRKHVSEHTTEELCVCFRSRSPSNTKVRHMCVEQQVITIFLDSWQRILGQQVVSTHCFPLPGLQGGLESRRPIK